MCRHRQLPYLNCEGIAPGVARGIWKDIHKSSGGRGGHSFYRNSAIHYYLEREMPSFRECITFIVLSCVLLKFLIASY